MSINGLQRTGVAEGGLHVVVHGRRSVVIPRPPLKPGSLGGVVKDSRSSGNTFHLVGFPGT